MCQPSASTAIELNHQPPAISTIIIANVSQIARRTLASAIGLPASKAGDWQWWSRGAFSMAHVTAAGPLPSNCNSVTSFLQLLSPCERHSVLDRRAHLDA